MNRIIMTSFFLIITCFIPSQCANDPAATPETGSTTTTAGAGVTASSVKVKTGANGLLGYGLEINHTSLTILTTTGWIVKLNYDGTVYSESFTYSLAGCTGTPYYPGKAIYGKTILYNGTNYYKPASSPTNQAGASISYNSADGASSCFNTTGTTVLAPLTSSTGLTEAGLPATITGPITLEAP